MAVKKVTVKKTIDADFDYSGGTYTGSAMQICIDSDRIDEDWINQLNVKPKGIAKSSHDDVEAKLLVFNFKKLVRSFRVHGFLSNTKVSGTHTGATHNTILTIAAGDFLSAGVGIGMTLSNDTDGSSGTITAVTATTITVDDLTGGTSNDFVSGDVCTITQTANVKKLLLQRCIWDGNAGSAASLSIPGGDSDLPPTQNLEGFVRGAHFTKTGDRPNSELDAIDHNTKIFEVTLDFIVGDAA